MMPSMSTTLPDQRARREHVVLRVCRELVNRAPLLLPLVVVIGVLCGGSVGWSTACVALTAALALRAYRVLLCAFLCGAIMVLCQALRQRAVEELQSIGRLCFLSNSLLSCGAQSSACSIAVASLRPILSACA